MISSPAEYYVILSPALGGAPQFVDDDGGCDSGRAGRMHVRFEICLVRIND